MMKADFVLGAQLMLAAILMWTCFCRLVKTDEGTHREVRWAILFEGVAGGVVFGAPLLPALMPLQIHWRAGTTPTWCWVTLLAAVTVVQMVTAKYWAHGQAPAQFQRSPKIGGVALAMMLLALGLITAGPGPAVAASAQRAPRGSLPFAVLAPGQHGECVAAEGCAAMALSDLKALLDSAEAYGRATCLDPTANRRPRVQL